MTSIFFQPWRGDCYGNGFLGKRALVLGESHYDWDKEEPIDKMPLLTQRCIQEQIDGLWSKPFWTNIAATFLGHLPELSEKKAFWNSVAFYNYVQSSAGYGPRKRPTPQQWQDAWVPFTEVLGELKPEVVIVLGYRLWENLPSHGSAGPRIEKAPRQKDTWRYAYAGGSCLAYGIRHPSAGFSSSLWHPHVLSAVSIA